MKSIIFVDRATRARSGKTRFFRQFWLKTSSVKGVEPQRLSDRFPPHTPQAVSLSVDGVMG